MESVRYFWQKYKNIMMTGIFCGFIAHGSILFYKYIWHDDSSALFGVLDYGFGRWMTTLTGKITARLMSGWTYSVPLLNGFISIVIIALSCCLTIEILEIKGTAVCIGLICIFESFPAVTGTFGYMFLAPYYFQALFFSVLGVWFMIQENRKYWIAGCVCFGIVPGFYQAYIGCFLSLMLLWMAGKVFRSRLSWKRYAAYGFRFAGSAVAGLAVYYTGMRVSLYLSGSSLTSYEGIADAGNTEFTAYIRGIYNAYRYFLFPEKMMEVYRHEYAFMYPMGLLKFYYLLLLIVILMTILLLVSAFRTNITAALQMLVITVLLPAAFNFIFIMCPSESTMIHSIMVYAEVFLFCYAALCGEILIEKTEADSCLPEKISSMLHYAGTVIICLFGCLYVWFSNVTYLRMQMQYQQTASSMTSLTACIRMAENYKNTTPVAFVIITDHNHIDRNFPKYQEMAGTRYINPYGLDYMYPFLSKTGLLNSLKNVCGFTPVVYEEERVLEDEVIQKMPCWPDKGSIRPYCTKDGENIVVVKI